MPDNPNSSEHKFDRGLDQQFDAIRDINAPDVWERALAPELTKTVSGRTNRIIFTAAAAVILFVGLIAGVWLMNNGAETETVIVDVAESPDAEIEIAERFEPAPVANLPQQAFWTGTELLFWETRDQSTELDEQFVGLALNVATGEWRSLPLPPVTGTLHLRAIDWTGEELIVCCGNASDSALGGMPLAQAYNPTSNTWREVASPPLGGSGYGDWSGTELLVITYGGAMAYNPVGDSWRSLADPVTVSSRFSTSWDGFNWFVWPSSIGRFTERGLHYDEENDRWRTLRAPDVDGWPAQAETVSTGEQLVVLGGLPGGIEGASERFVVSVGDINAEGLVDEWVTMPDHLPEPDSFEGNLGSHSAIWTGEEVLIHIGALASGATDKGVLSGLDPLTGGWHAYQVVDEDGEVAAAVPLLLIGDWIVMRISSNQIALEWVGPDDSDFPASIATPEPTSEFSTRETIEIADVVADRDGMHLRVQFVGNLSREMAQSCGRDYEVEIDETTSMIEVTVHYVVRHDVDWEVAGCHAENQFWELSVEILQPLSGRPVVDGSSGSVKPVLDEATAPFPTWVPTEWEPQVGGIQNSVITKWYGLNRESPFAYNIAFSATPLWDGQPTLQTVIEQEIAAGNLDPVERLVRDGSSRAVVLEMEDGLDVIVFELDGFLVRVWSHSDVPAETVETFLNGLSPRVGSDFPPSAFIDLFQVPIDVGDLVVIQENEDWPGQLATIEPMGEELSAEGFNDFIDEAKPLWGFDPAIAASALFRYRGVASYEQPSLEMEQLNATDWVADFVVENLPGDSTAAVRYIVLLREQPDGTFHFVSGTSSHRCGRGTNVIDFQTEPCI